MKMKMCLIELQKRCKPLLNKLMMRTNHNISGINSFFITTPIFYINSVPHIGHLYTTILADAQNRFQKLLGAKGFLSTGTDEHGIKVMKAATERNQSFQTFCDDVSFKFKDSFEKFNVDFNVFVRTSWPSHKNAARHFFRILNEKGYIYFDSYEGWYCAADEMFLSEKQVTDMKDFSSGVIKRVSSVSGREVEFTSEKNYMFKLSAFQDDLLYWLKNDGIVKPRLFQDILIKDVKEGLSDISISRCRNRIPWGIQVPNDETQTIYVWLDGLVNYLTVCGYPDRHLSNWPADFHVIGKEILKFHGIYWPAFLIAAGLQPPRHLLVHSHWLIDHEKMSKSKGNVVDPVSRIPNYTVEGLRYYLLREGVPHSDGNYNDSKVAKILNAELANTLGNLLNRCTSPVLNPQQKFLHVCPHVFRRHYNQDGQELITAVEQMVASVRQHYVEFNFYHGLEDTMRVLRQTNLFIQSHKPWELKTEPSRRGTVIAVAMETLRVCGIILQPVIPLLACRILDRLGIKPEERTWKDAEKNFMALKDKTNERKDFSLGPDRGLLFHRVKEFAQQAPPKETNDLKSFNL